MKTDSLTIKVFVIRSGMKQKESEYKQLFNKSSGGLDRGGVGDIVGSGEIMLMPRHKPNDPGR